MSYSVCTPQRRVTLPKTSQSQGRNRLGVEGGNKVLQKTTGSVFLPEPNSKVCGVAIWMSYRRYIVWLVMHMSYRMYLNGMMDCACLYLR